MRIAVTRGGAHCSAMRISLQITCLSLFVSLPVATLSAQQSSGRVHDADSLQWRPAGAGAEMAIVDGNPQAE